jgi:hypothetical protein
LELPKLANARAIEIKINVIIFFIVTYLCFNFVKPNIEKSGSFSTTTLLIFIYLDTITSYPLALS